MQTLTHSIQRLGRSLETLWRGVWERMEAHLPPDELKIHRATVETGVTAERELEALRGTRAALQIQQIQELCQAAGFYANDPVERVFNALIRQGAPKTAAAVRAKATELALSVAGKRSTTHDRAPLT